MLGSLFLWVSNPICNYDSDYDVDLADFAAFSDKRNWEACWHGNYAEVMYAMGGGESMMMAVPVSALTSATLQPTAVEEKTVAEQIYDLAKCVEFLEMVWLEDTNIQQEIEAGDWEDFMDSVAGNLKDLEKVKTKKDK